MSPATRYLYALSFVAAGTGYLLPFWPLCVLGILIAALSGRYVFAVALALLIDLAFGTPTGTLKYLLVPFTLLALIASIVRVVGGAYFLDKTPPDRI